MNLVAFKNINQRCTNPKNTMQGALRWIRHVVADPIVSRIAVFLVQADTSWALLGPGTIPWKSEEDNGVLRELLIP